MSFFTSFSDQRIELSAADRNIVINEVIDQINRVFPTEILTAPTDDERQKVTDQVANGLSNALRIRGIRLTLTEEQALGGEICRRLLGLGFLDLLLPPARTDLSEITLYSNGLLQVMRKGEVRFEDAGIKPEAGEVWRVIDRLLGPQHRVLNETNPSVNAKLPRSPANPGGGRIKILHPCIAPPGSVPSINIRLYEQKPVLPDWLVERGALSGEMMETLRQAMESGQRILICGETRTGKTTLLSALCNFLPKGWRIVKIEDPEEIWIDSQTVQTVEARPQAIGTEVRPYTLADGVDDAMRMSPDYLVVGEVRDGHAASALFRALMSGHSGACTFHAASPRDAAKRLQNIVGMDMNTSEGYVAQMFSMAMDVIVQIAIEDEKRRVVTISKISKELKGGNVWFEPIWNFKKGPAGADWEKVGEL